MSYDLALPPPAPPSPLPSVSSTAATHRKSEKERHLAGGGGGDLVETEPNHTIKCFLDIIHYSLYCIYE